MKHLMSVLVIAVAAFSGSAFANTHKEAPNMAKGASAPMAGTQQSKMGMCNKDAGEMKGDERKAFMKTCLSSKKETQQGKMKTCNASAAGKKGDERKAHMKECLSS